MTDAAAPRLHIVDASDVRSDGDYVLYWCRAYRRAYDNLALDHAAARANELRVPLVVYESLDVRHPHANDRLHTFVLEGAREMQDAIEARGASYAFFLPCTADEAGRSRALLTLARRAALVVTDWVPSGFGASSLWSRTARIAARCGCRFEAFDDAVVVPMSRLSERASSARALRPRVQAQLGAHLVAADDRSVRAPALRAIAWPFEPWVASTSDLAHAVARCDVDHGVAPITRSPGGGIEARSRLERFVSQRLRQYRDERNDLERKTTSALSAHLHFGHVSARAVARAAIEASEPGENRDAFIEALVVRRSLAFNHAMNSSDATNYASVPGWARSTLAVHIRDARVGPCMLDDLESARTPDPVWNAAQEELLRDGTIHPRARVLWAKAAIALTARPDDAFRWLVHLNDKYALDGRDPAAYASIAGCFGLHDRPFVERAVFGHVRSMSSSAFARGAGVAEYMAGFGIDAESAMEALTPRRKAKTPTPDDAYDQQPMETWPRRTRR